MDEAATTNAIGPGTILANTYRLERALGEGGMGLVFAAQHLRLPKRVAIKILRSALEVDFLARFRQEAEIASRIGHPNIIDVLDFNTLPSGAPYLVMELLEGESLATRARRGPLPLASALSILRQIASALQAAHDEGIVHRDLKPENVFLVPRELDGGVTDHVKILDFGISKVHGSAVVRTSENVVMGTPRYMAPEQALGWNQEIDGRTDQFALAVIAFELLSGVPPFDDDNGTKVMFKIVHEEPRPLVPLAPDTPAHVIAAIARALSKNPHDRFANMAELAHALTGKPFAATGERARRPSQEPWPRTDDGVRTAAASPRAREAEAPPTAAASPRAREAEAPRTAAASPRAREPEAPPTVAASPYAREAEAPATVAASPRGRALADPATVPASPGARTPEPDMAVRPAPTLQRWRWLVALLAIGALGALGFALTRTSTDERIVVADRGDVDAAAAPSDAPSIEAPPADAAANDASVLSPTLLTEPTHAPERSKPVGRPKASALSPEATTLLEEAERLLAEGKFSLAKAAAERALRTVNHVRAHLVLVEIACRRSDLSTAHGAMRLMPRSAWSTARSRCDRAGFPIENPS